MGLMQIFRPKWKHTDPVVRLSAVEKLTKPKHLLTVIYEDDNCNVCKAAFDHLTELGCLSEAELKALNEKIEKKILNETALNADDPNARLAALERIKNHRTIEKIAMDDPVPDVRLAAVLRLQNKKILRNIADFDSDSKVSEAAEERLGGRTTHTLGKDVNKEWFLNKSNRSRPRAGSNINISKVRTYILSEWMKLVTSHPMALRCTVIDINSIDAVLRTFFDILKESCDISSSKAVGIFNNYLGAACPECFGGLDGSLLQTIASYKNSAGAIIGDPAVQRVLDGFCPHCSSRKFYIIWYGD